MLDTQALTLHDLNPENSFPIYKPVKARPLLQPFAHIFLIRIYRAFDHHILSDVGLYVLTFDPSGRCTRRENGDDIKSQVLDSLT